MQFPKGNKKSAPIKIDACIFDDKQWTDYYTQWRESKDDDAVEWLRIHLIGTIEFKRSDGKDIKAVYTSQVKPEIKESEATYCIGFYYDNERLFIFQKKNGTVLRYDESKNQKVRWTPSVGQDQATIKWDSCTSPCDTETRWSEHLLSFSSSSSSTVSP